MNQTSSSYGEPIAAIFSDRDTARRAANELKNAGFDHVWMALTEPSDEDASYDANAQSRSTERGEYVSGDRTVGTTRGSVSTPSGMSENQVRDDNPLGAFGRFFSGGSGDEGLRETLMRRGFDQSTAERIDRELPANGVVLTAEGDASRASDIIAAAGGQLIGDAYSGTGRLGTGRDTFDRSNLTPRGDRTDVSGEQTLRLREERLNVDKQRVQGGEAVIGKDVVEQQASIDVPIVHEELFIERRPVTSGQYDDNAPITDGKEIRIPLTREEVNVQKRAVTTEEVAVGKREVQETRHVTDTVRREQLHVDDPSGAAVGVDLDDPTTGRTTTSGNTIDDDRNRRT